jgi:competence protein ComEA
MKNEQKITGTGFFSGWSLAVFLLALIIIAGGIFIYLKTHDNPGVEISRTPEKTPAGQIYISGCVNNPGIYPLYAGDTLQELINAAGGLKDEADTGTVTLSVGLSDSEKAAQKIDLNKAESWLLEAVPGIGKTKAGAIIAYREEHGYFHDVNELLNVPGFGETLIGQITDFLTVHD